GQAKMPSECISPPSVSESQPAQLVNTSRTTLTTLGNNLIAVTGAGDDVLTVFSKTGDIINNVKLPGGTRQGLHNLGPVVAGSSLYVVSGPTLYKFRTADLLKPDAQPAWVRTYAGLALSSMLVPDEDHVVVAVNDVDVSRRLVTLEGDPVLRRWR
ncbi:hypothetical protein ACI3L1_17885, partial [Deinococcus sp. SM5_A1]|uniref:hypothetical protein n=1 Tax=Deinococcus sp. SM5_A1 TaxID=3379094 RepID=UPI003858ED23